MTKLADVPGSPLQSLTWKRQQEKVEIVFREDTHPYDKIKFLTDLMHQAHKDLGDLIYGV